MLAVLVVLVFYITAVQSAFAGAWMRDVETVFTSVGSTLRLPDGVLQQEYGFYAEYGVSKRFTLGLSINETPGLSGHVLVFGRMPLRLSTGKTKLAVEFGIGGHHRQMEWDGMVKTTLLLGRGISTRWGNGWLSVDGALEWRRPNPRPSLKLDATVGLSNGNRFRPMVQFESTYSSGNSLIWSVIPSVLIDGKKKSTWVVGLERKSSVQTTFGIRLGLWRQF